MMSSLFYEMMMWKSLQGDHGSVTPERRGESLHLRDSKVSPKGRSDLGDSEKEGQDG